MVKTPTFYWPDGNSALSSDSSCNMDQSVPISARKGPSPAEALSPLPSTWTVTRNAATSASLPPNPANVQIQA